MSLPNRRYERVPVKLQATLGGESVRLGNLSRGGAFVYGLAAASLFDTVTLSLNGKEKAAQIRWVRGSGDTGFGVQFDVELEPKEFRALTQD